jgi:AraC family transcriptional activator of pobA
MEKPIPAFQLHKGFFDVSRKKIEDTGFGMDHTKDVLDKGFVIYSCGQLKDKLGPLRSNVYRIGFCMSGSVQMYIGLESFTHGHNTMHFNMPDRLFGFKNKSKDINGYYLQFTPEFMEDMLSSEQIENKYPFFNYAHVPFLTISDEEATMIKGYFDKISNEVHLNGPEMLAAIKMHINLIMIEAKRSYLRQCLHQVTDEKSGTLLLSRFKKEVSRHFIAIRTVKEYALRLFISPNHLNKVVKKETGKSAGQLIGEMLCMEIKALLIHSELSISEIANRLDFTDASHFSKFFKRYAGITPMSYRNSAKMNAN